MKTRLLKKLRRIFWYNYAPSIDTYYLHLNGKKLQTNTRHKARKAVREAILNHGRKYYYQHTKRI